MNYKYNLTTQQDLHPNHSEWQGREHPPDYKQIWRRKSYISSLKAAEASDGAVGEIQYEPTEEE